MLEASCAIWYVHYGYAFRWDRLLGCSCWIFFVCFFVFPSRPLPFSMHRNPTSRARETAPLPKKQVQATMSCFSGTTFYISHKNISCHCSTLPALDSCSSLPPLCIQGFLGAGTAALTKHLSELACETAVPPDPLVLLTYQNCGSQHSWQKSYSCYKAVCLNCSQHSSLICKQGGKGRYHQAKRWA